MHSMCNMKFVLVPKFTLFFALALLLSALSMNSEGVQCFFKAFSDEDARIDYSLSLSDGNYVIVGLGPDLSGEYSDLYVEKIGSDGKVVWARAYDMGLTDGPMGAMKTSDGNFVVATASGLYPDGYYVHVLKLNGNGAIVWRKKLDFLNLGYVVSMVETSDGGILLAGDTGFDNGLLVKLDRLGRVLWAKSCGGDSDDMFRAVAKNTDNSIALAGVLNISGSYAMPASNWFSRLDNGGNFIWSEAFVFGDAWFNSATSTVAAPNGATIFGGYFDNGDAENDGFLIKIGKGGGVVWKEAFGTPQSDVIFTGRFVDQGVLIAGNTGNEDDNGFLIRFDQSGVIALQKLFGGVRQDEIDMITPLPEGFLISGVALSWQAMSFVAVLNQQGTQSGCSTFRNAHFTVKPVTVSVSTPQFTITPIDVKSVDAPVRTRKVTIQSRSICK